MHERAFMVTTTYPFPCMIFSFSRSVGVTIWHIDKVKTPLALLILAPRRGPRQKLPTLGEYLADTVAHALTAT